MLHDRKSQAGTAGGFGVALIHPIEPFEDPILMLSGNADARITNGQLLARNMDFYTAAGNVVFDGVVTEIIDDLL